MSYMDALTFDLIPVQDAYTEAYELFTEHNSDGVNLGMLAPKEPSISLTIGKHDYHIKQSPSLLRSNHVGGTTGAALWRSGVLAAEWLSSIVTSHKKTMLDDIHTTIELGAGIAGLCSCVLVRNLAGNGRIIATDMPQSLKLLRENVKSNTENNSAGGAVKTSSKCSTNKVEIHALDWEQDDAPSLLKSIDLGEGVDLVIACDCVYNNALIKPLMQACVAICRMRLDTAAKPTTCLVVQQLRHEDVTEEWLECVMSSFIVWRLPDHLLSTSLSPKNGFVAHILRLKRNET